MEVYSIGFAKRSAESFFEALRGVGIEQLIDVRLRNASQLAGYTKRDNLVYFLKSLLGASYRHEPLLAPEAGLLDAYRRKNITWADYEDRFMALMKDRRIQEVLSPSIFDLRTVLLCSEYDPMMCHRRLVLEYLRREWNQAQLEIVHL